ncbi:MAG TPA: hypothetical protein PLG77_08770 [Burkholderiaceae bacterium]|nr:hypothetical protein [Burkholderiaceae bacterium]HRP28504.1 hypothetical protein [Burkholderiaceae bacterium]
MNAMLSPRTTWPAALVVAILAATAGVASAAGVPDSLSNLKGRSESKASEAFASAGYYLQGEKEQWDRKDSFWWGQRDRQCLRQTSRFGLVTGVALVGEADCTNARTSGAPVGRPGNLVAADLLGLSRAGAEAKLAAAGFNAMSIDERPEVTNMLWSNQRTGQCIAAAVVGNKFDQTWDLPSSRCR